MDTSRPSEQGAAPPERGRRRRERLLRLLVLVAVVALVVAIALLRQHLPSARIAGYPGIFLLSLLSSATVLVPLPGVASVCAGGSLLGLNLFLIAVLAGVGETVGELVGYIAGFGGHGLVRQGPLYRRLEGWVRRRGGAVLFLFSLVPNPLFDFVGIAAGALRYPLHWFLLIVASGKLLKGLGVAYACRLGMEGLLRWFQGLNG